MGNTESIKEINLKLKYTKIFKNKGINKEKKQVGNDSGLDCRYIKFSTLGDVSRNNNNDKTLNNICFLCLN